MQRDLCPTNPTDSCSLLLRRKAFTLVELVIVLLIIGIIAAAVAPRFAASLCYHRAESAAKRIKADLALARKYARSTSTNQTVSFVVASDRYSLAGVPDLNHGSQIYEVDLSDALCNVSIVSAAFDAAADSDVEFNGYGVPDNGGTIVIESGNCQRTIVVDSETGNASIQ